MIATISFEVEVSGEVTHDEIKEYIEFLLGCGSCSHDNPLISDDSDCEIDCYDVQVL